MNLLNHNGLYMISNNKVKSITLIYDSRGKTAYKTFEDDTSEVVTDFPWIETTEQYRLFVREIINAIDKMNRVDEISTVIPMINNDINMKFIACVNPDNIDEAKELLKLKCDVNSYDCHALYLCACNNNIVFGRLILENKGTPSEDAMIEAINRRHREFITLMVEFNVVITDEIRDAANNQGLSYMLYKKSVIKPKSQWACFGFR